MANKINVPVSMCKAFLASKGLHVKPEATKKFENMFREWANKIATIATENATEAKRKTIYPEDFDAEEVDVDEEDTEVDEEDSDTEED